MEGETLVWFNGKVTAGRLMYVSDDDLHAFWIKCVCE